MEKHTAKAARPFEVKESQIYIQNLRASRLSQQSSNKMFKHFWERLRSANSSISTNTTIPLTFASSLGQNGVRSSTSDADFEKSLHLSVALAGMVVRLIIQVHIKKERLCTELAVASFIGFYGLGRDGCCYGILDHI